MTKFYHLVPESDYNSEPDFVKLRWSAVLFA